MWTCLDAPEPCGHALIDMSWPIWPDWHALNNADLHWLTWPIAMWSYSDWYALTNVDMSWLTCPDQCAHALIDMLWAICISPEQCVHSIIDMRSGIQTCPNWYALRNVIEECNWYALRTDWTMGHALLSCLDCDALTNVETCPDWHALIWSEQCRHALSNVDMPWMSCPIQCGHALMDMPWLIWPTQCGHALIGMTHTMWTCPEECSHALTYMSYINETKWIYMW